jgi:hypothetical protein
MGKECCEHKEIKKDNEAIIHETHSSEKFPLFLRIIWVILVVWGVSYLVLYSFPDLKKWI